MKEQVKEWIVDKNLTTDSFDSIMIGDIYTSPELLEQANEN